VGNLRQSNSLIKKKSLPSLFLTEYETKILRVREYADLQILTVSNKQISKKDGALGRTHSIITIKYLSCLINP